MGDTSSHKSVVDSKPNGDFSIEKIECIRHVQKRLGKRVLEFKKANNGQTLADGR